MIELYDYQEECINYVRNNKKVLITMEGGTGKTITSLLSIDSGTTVIIVQSIEIKKKWQQDISNNNIGDTEVITLNEAGKFIPESDNIIIDESHKLCNIKSKRYKKIKKNLNKRIFNYIILLSATPIRRHEYDIYNQMALFGEQFKLCYAFPAVMHFNKHFMNWRKEYLFYVDKYVDVPFEFKEEKRDEFNSYVDMFSYSHKIFDVHEEYIKLTKKKMEIYDQVKNKYFYEDETFTPAVKLNYLMQLSNSTLTLSELSCEDYDFMEKINVIKKLLEKHGRVVITYAFNKEKDLLMNNFESITDNLEDFENGMCDVYVRQISRSEGVDILSANVIVFFSINYDPIAFQQFKWRIKRVNSTFKDLYYYYLSFDNTIEKDIYLIVNKKVKKNDLLKNL